MEFKGGEGQTTPPPAYPGIQVPQQDIVSVKSFVRNLSKHTKRVNRTSYLEDKTPNFYMQ